LNDKRRARFRGIHATSHQPDLAASHLSQSVEIASTKA
jgi:hypothetical protein